MSDRKQKEVAASEILMQVKFTTVGLPYLRFGMADRQQLDTVVISAIRVHRYPKNKHVLVCGR